jgi:hypothetical protein
VPAVSIFRVQDIKILKMVAESLEHIVYNTSWEWFQLNSKDLKYMCVALVTKKRRCTKAVYVTSIQAAQLVLSKTFSG